MRMDGQRAWSREVEFVGDRGISGVFGGCSVCRLRSHGDLWLGGAAALPSRVPASEAARKRVVKGVHRAHDRVQPGPVHAADWRLCSPRPDRCQAGRPRFQRYYTAADIALLATVDEAHERLSGPARRQILKQEFEFYGKAEFERLAALSNGQLYNLRQSQSYRLRLCQYEKTRPAAVQIGERKKPAPNGQPGFLRIDTVHYGDSSEGTRIYHINAVDEITQWEVILATPRISEAWLMPLLENILQQFSFVILNFHSDNGSEFINKTVAELPEKLLIEQTKSRHARAATTAWWKPKRQHRTQAHRLGSHLTCPRRAHQSVLHRLPQPLRQLSPPLSPDRSPD